MLGKLIRKMDMMAGHKLVAMRVGLRLGPVFGLLGTLIPMGPALMSISNGDMTTMSNDLIIAFSTTVGGLAAGSVFYVMLAIRQNWYARDIGDIDGLEDLCAAGTGPRFGERGR